jgi:hypothetical protein
MLHECHVFALGKGRSLTEQGAIDPRFNGT